MGNSVLVRRKHGNSALAEHSQRLRMVELRDRIHEARVLDLCLAMAISGKEWCIDPETGEIKGDDLLDQKTRAAYMSLLVNKLISNAVAPKEIAHEDSHAKWADIIAAEIDNEAGHDA